MNLPSLQAALDPIQSSRLAHLRYVSDYRPGITRKKCERSFRCFDPEGKPIHDEKTLARIKSLAIPPAWRRVLICPLPSGCLHFKFKGKSGKLHVIGLDLPGYGHCKKSAQNETRVAE